MSGRCAVPHGHPTRDPHGDPIPRDGGVNGNWGVRLDAAPAGSGFHIETCPRPRQRRSALVDLGIHPGVRIDVTERLPFGGPLRVRVGTAAHALGEPLTHLVHGRVVA